jgi:hypothetical protein
MFRVRLKYEKTGPVRFVSHRDLMRMFRRSFASAEIPVSYSQGFNPHPRFSFGPSLRTGWEGRGEYLDAYLEQPCDDIAERCTRHLPEGLRVLESGRVSERVPKLAADVTGSRYDVYLAEEDVYGSGHDTPRPWLDRAADAGTEEGAAWKPLFLARLTAEITARFGAGRPRGDEGETGETAPPVVIEARCSPAGGGEDAPVVIGYFSTMHGGKSLFPEDILTPLLGEPARYAGPVRVVRTALYVERDGEYVSPMSRAALENTR